MANITAIGTGGSGSNAELLLVGTAATDVVLSVSPTATDDSNLQPGRVPVLQANGDLASATVGGMKVILGPFTTTNLTTSASAVALRLCGVAGMTQIAMAFPGSILGIAAKANAAVTAGTARFAVSVNGATVFSAVNSATGVTVIRNTQAKDTDAFVAGDTIGVKITTAASYAPTSLEWVANVVAEI